MSYVIKLCSRNQTSPYAVTRTDVSSNVITGFSILEKLDDSLDTGSIILRGLTTAMPYNMFDWIEIYIDTTLLYSLRIGGDRVRLISKNPLRYEHTLSLVEHTKILERFQISGKTFTQPLTGTLKVYRDVLLELIATTPVETLDNSSDYRLCGVTTDSEFNFLSTTASPEFTFKDISLREAFKQVADSFDAIPRLHINSSDELELTFDFVNELKTLITSENDFIEKSVQQNIDLHATSIESNVLNLVNDISENNESVEYYPTDGTYATPRSDDYIFDFTKSYLYTPKRIYQVDELIVNVLAQVVWFDDLGNPTYLYGSSAGTSVLIQVDMTDRVLEYNEYKTLDAVFVADGNMSKTKNNTIFYEYRKPNIQIGGTYGLFDTNINLEEAINYAIYQKVLDDGILEDGKIDQIATVISSDISNGEILFRTKYTPLPTETRLSIDKQDNSDVSYRSALISNQQGRLVNLEQFTNNLYGKINRIGNSELQLSNREIDIDDLYDIGDYTDELYIVTDKEVIFYKDYVYANYGLSKNFNKISDFIGINSEIRQWEIGEQNTLNRNLLYKEHIEIDAVTSGIGTFSSQLMTVFGANTYLETFDTTSTYTPVRGSMIESSYANTVLVAMSSNGGGNSLIFSWQLPSNIYAGNYIETISSQKANNFERYTDEDGELGSFTLHMFDNLSTGDTTETQFLATADAYPNTSTSYINNDLITNDSSFILSKDRREIIGGTIHFQQNRRLFFLFRQFRR